MKIRESNFELLRLVCMFYILLHHFIVHGLKVAGYCGEEINIYGVICNSFLVIAVNCFILISGYFGIKLSWKSFTNLCITCIFYILTLTIVGFIYNDFFSLKELLYSFMPFSYSHYWFITSYFYLFLLSPLINKAIDNFTKKEFICSLIILALITFYFGFFRRGNINSNGYNLMNFIFLYFIARFISIHSKNILSKAYRKIYLSSYIINSLIVATVVMLIYYSPVNNFGIIKWGYAYNNPFVIVSSISFFLLFGTFNFRNNFVNQLAKSSLAIYLIHENTNVRGILYKYVHEIGENVSGWLLFIILPIFALIIMIICIGIDKFRSYIITNAIEKRISNINWKNILKRLFRFAQTVNLKRK